MREPFRISEPRGSATAAAPPRTGLRTDNGCTTRPKSLRCDRHPIQLTTKDYEHASTAEISAASTFSTAAATTTHRGSSLRAPNELTTATSTAGRSQGEMTKAHVGAC